MGLRGGTLTEGFQVPSRGALEGVSQGWLPDFQRGLKGYLKEGLQGTFRELTGGYLKVTLRGDLRGGVSCFYSFGEPLKTWTYAMLICIAYHVTLLYS